MLMMAPGYYALVAEPTVSVAPGLFTSIYERVGSTQQLRGYCQATAQGACTTFFSFTVDVYDMVTAEYVAYVSEGVSTAGPPPGVRATSGGASPFGSGPMGLAELDGGSNPSVHCSQRCHGDPINSATGEFWESSVDIEVPGVGPDLVLARTFSTARRDIVGGLGHGWRTSYEMELTLPEGQSDADLVDAPTLRLIQENGSTLDFSRTADGYTAPARVQAELNRHDDGSFTFVRQQSERFTFSPDGRLASVTDRNGNSISLHYDNAALVRVSDGSGRFVELTWSEGLISEAVDHADRSVEYVYSEEGHLTEVHLPDGSVKAYSYDEEHRVGSLTHADGGVTENEYDMASRVVQQTDPLGRVTSFVYGADGVAITDPTGAVTVERYVNGQVRSETRAAGTDLEATWTYAYGSTNQVTAVSDPLGRVTRFTYDARGNRTSVTDPLGRVSTTTYDEWNNPLVVTNPAEEATSFAYDEQGNLLSSTAPDGALTSFTVNDDGTVATATDPLGRVTSYAYDEHGYVASVTGPDSAVETTVHDSLGRLVSSIDPRGTVPGVDPQEFTSTFSYDADGRELTATDPVGAVVAHTYDAAGRPATVTDPAGAVSTREYDAAGQVTGVVNAAGHRTVLEYDGGGRVTSVTDPTGATTSTEYDVLGRAVTVTDPEGRVTSTEYDPGDRVVATTSPAGARTSYTYDDADQLLTVTDPLGGVTTTAYDDAGRPVSVTDADGRTVTTSYDPAGRIIEITRADGSSQQWSYDEVGQEATYTDSAGQVTAYTYDEAGRRASATDPAGRVTAYAYDLAGHLVTVTHPDGQAVTYAYDGAGRQIETAYSDATPDVAATYDLAGRLVQVLDGTGATTYSYDVLGQVEQVVTPAGTVGYGWDDAGRLAELTYPTGQAVTYAYDDAGQITGLTDWAGRDFTYAWTDDGQIDTLTYPNGVVTDYDHDDAGQALGITTTNDTAVDLLDLGYAYTPAGLLTDQTTSRSTQARAPPTAPVTSSTVAWDAQARIEQITGHLGGTFAYAAAGSPTTLPGGRALAYDTARQLTFLIADPQDGTDPVEVEFSYDDRGNRHTATTGFEATTHGYDLADRLTTITTADGDTTSYTYAANNLRASTTTGSGAEAVTEAYVWETTAPVPLLLTDASHAYLYGAGTAPLAQVDLTDDTAVDYLHTDLIGSVRTITDAAGQVTADADYDAYGTPHHPTTDPVAAITRFGYAGEYTDPTGYIYLRNRHYDPHTAQFVSVDPLVEATRNPYGYTYGNPLQYVDPLGLWSWKPWEWTKDEWGTVATVAGTVAMVATLATLTVATGGAALAVVGAVSTAAAVASTAAGVVSTVHECRDGGPWQDCVTSAAVTAIPYGIGRYARGVSGTMFGARHVAESSRIAARQAVGGLTVAGWGLGMAWELCGGW